jgi:NAD(P)-dependent dehydrogenase (short-subunit alcohol dehydrogenase family)
MTLLASLHPLANVGVVGASGGIGRAFVELLAGDAGIRQVHAFSRTPFEWADKKVVSHSLDLANEDSIEAAAAAAASEALLDLVIVATGILHRGEDIRPEKSMREIESRALAEVLAINAIGPSLVAKHFLPRLRRDHKAVFAALSARVGSIGDNRLGGWTAYRMSKAALNMLIRTMAIEQARTAPGAVVVALHPGTVSTELSRPFTGRVPASQMFTPRVAATRLLGVLDSLTHDQTGGFFAYDGARIDY